MTIQPKILYKEKETSKYVELSGIRTWYSEMGIGEPLIMLHPGGVDSRALAPNSKVLSVSFHVFLPERRGHGHTPDGNDPYSYELMADDLIHFLENVVGVPARIMGCSDGAVVGLLVAKKRPDLVERLICAAGVFNRNGWYDPDAASNVTELPEFMINSYADVSPDGVDHLPIVLKKLNKMHTDGPLLTSSDLKDIGCRTLVMIGDDDEVTLEHAVEFYRSLPKGELAIIPGASHGLLVEKPDLCNKIMIDFLTLDPVQTFAPIRRI
jgi:pimeloyl-ACP methyl ester carboxylesterase